MPSSKPLAELTVAETQRITGGGTFNVMTPNGVVVDTAHSSQLERMALYRLGGYVVTPRSFF
jgi:hypothetical protein